MASKRSGDSWFYGHGGQARVFGPEEEVPKGWKDAPNKVVEPKTKEAEGFKPDQF